VSYSLGKNFKQLDWFICWESWGDMLYGKRAVPTEGNSLPTAEKNYIFLPAAASCPALKEIRANALKEMSKNSKEQKTSNGITAISIHQNKKKKKKKKNNDEEEQTERGLVAWFKYSLGLTGGIKYVNKWLESGGRYEGSWHVGSRCPHRQGSMLYIDGETYDGKWKFGVRRGWGAATYPDGSTYEGSWKNDEFSGKGKFVASNGDRYMGSWEQGMRHGRGAYIWENGNTYDGI